jgi:hypothetical protein
MRFQKLAGSFLRRLARRPAEGKPLSPHTAARLAALCADAGEEDLNCDGVHALIDQFAECVARGQDAAALMPLVQSHLGHCPGCEEDFVALLRMMEAKSDDRP